MIDIHFKTVIIPPTSSQVSGTSSCILWRWQRNLQIDIGTR